MPLKSALLVSSSEDFLNPISTMLQDCGYGYIEKLTNTAEALRRSQIASFDLCMVNLRNCGDAVRFSSILSEQGIYVVVFSSRENFEQIENYVQKSSIMVVAKPVQRTELLKLIDFFSRIISKQRAPEHSGETKELMGKAKAYLMERFEMSEEHAHRYLQKISMDNRMQLRDLCSIALDTFKI